MRCDPAPADRAAAGGPDGRDARAQARERLRAHMRARRRALSQRERTSAAHGFASVIRRSRLLQAGKRVGVYFKQGSEADLRAVIELARLRGCLLYLPVITSYRLRRMRFLRFDATTPLRPNRYGILEPRPASSVPLPVRRLDLVLVPLVAVDAQGWRLGSGAGYYDRCLQHLAPHAGPYPSMERRWRRPRLIGVAYEFQRVPRLDAQPWDVPLDAILTERALHATRRATAQQP